MKGAVLVTGVAGYIGSVLARRLLEEGYVVHGLDSLIYDNGGSVQSLAERPDFIFYHEDVHNIDCVRRLLAENRYEAVIHLAALVGDATCAMSPLASTRTNYEDTAALAGAIEGTHNGTLILASSASLYGQNHSQSVDEDSEIRPLSLYAWTKVLAEKAVQEVSRSHKDFNYCILRFSTAYGLSHRMRFDLVVNSFTLNAVCKKEVQVFGGSQVRPFVHVDDVSKAILLVLDKKAEVSRQIFNVGVESENLSILELAEMVCSAVPSTQIRVIDELRDQRSYRVSFDKVKGLGFRPDCSVKEGIVSIRDALTSQRLKDPFDRRYYNYPPQV